MATTRNRIGGLECGTFGSGLCKIPRRLFSGSEGLNASNAVHEASTKDNTRNNRSCRPASKFRRQRKTHHRGTSHISRLHPPHPPLQPSIPSLVLPSSLNFVIFLESSLFIFIFSDSPVSYRHPPSKRSFLVPGFTLECNHGGVNPPVVALSSRACQHIGCIIPEVNNSFGLCLVASSGLVSSSLDTVLSGSGSDQNEAHLVPGCCVSLFSCFGFHHPLPSTLSHLFLERHHDCCWYNR